MERGRFRTFRPKRAPRGQRSDLSEVAGHARQGAPLVTASKVGPRAKRW